MNDSWWVKPESLDDAQKEVIALPEGGSYLVTGPPGSGKSNLVLLRATHLARAGRPNVMIVVFNRLLRDFLEAGRANYPFRPDRIVTCVGWFSRLLREHGLPVPDVQDFSDLRRELAVQVKSALDDGTIPRVAQVVLLDEAQDYLPEEIELFTRLGTHLFAVADSHQRIYEDHDVVATLEGLADRSIELPYHYRNGRKICQFADSIGASMPNHTPLLPMSQYQEAPLPSTVDGHDSAQQAELILERLRVQVRAYPGEMLGVLCPRNSEAVAMAEFLSSSELSDRCVRRGRDDGYEALSEDSICIATIHAAKGLEFRAVHLAGMEHIAKHRGRQKRLTYVGATRAKTALNVYYSRRVPGYVEEALAATKPPPEPPDLSDLFSKES